MIGYDNLQKKKQRWAYPDEFADDLSGQGLSSEQVAEVLTISWEYVRSVVPVYTNWEKYMALVRLTQVGVVIEYNGDVVDIASLSRTDGTILGHDIHALIATLFGGTAVHEDMTREFTSGVLFASEKTRRQPSHLLPLYARALATSPANYFRLRDCDGLVRFFITAALACNDVTDWLTEDELQAMAELALTMYDSIAFYKHRAESEIANLYAYCGQDLAFRVEAYKTARALLWAIDEQWCRTVRGRCATNTVRQVPLIHVGMRRYRFVEDGLTLGMPETDEMIESAHKNVKLWYRGDTCAEEAWDERTRDVVTEQGHLLYRGLAEVLLDAEQKMCPHCTWHGIRNPTIGQFSGVELCPRCKDIWQAYIKAAWTRFATLLTL